MASEAGTHLRIVDLNPNRSLLDPKFDGYKLYFDPLPIYKTRLPLGLDDVKLQDDQYSYQHIKAFGIHNHLVADPWCPNAVYYISKEWEIMKTELGVGCSPDIPQSVFKIPNGVEQRLCPNRLNVSLEMLSEEWCIISDGTGVIHLVYTSKRSNNEAWRVSYSGQPLDSSVRPILMDSCMHHENEHHCCECVLLHVKERETQECDENKSSSFETILEWITFSSADASSWVVERRRQLAGPSTPDLVTLQPDGGGLYVASQKPFKLRYDSLKPVAEDTDEAPEEKADPAYTWSQTSEDLSVIFTVPDGTTKNDILFDLKSDFIGLSTTAGCTLLNGKLHGLVDRDGSTWIITGQRLEIFLSKVESSPWAGVVHGDERGEMVIDPEEVAKIHERLAHLTSESLNVDDKNEKPFNAQELEECDTSPDEASIMVRLDGKTNQISHQVFLASHQWLFNSRLKTGVPKAICLRHDVDGLLWQPRSEVSDDVNPWEHIATFNALGYVFASKQDKKFASCAPNHSFAVLCDCVRHVYIYRQPTPTLTPLRNRKTGEQVGAIAKQQVASLESVDKIMGVQATDNNVFVMTESMLYVISVTTNEL